MPELKTVAQVAPLLHVKPVTVRRLIRSGHLPYTKAGRRYLFTEEHIKTFIMRNERNVDSEGNREATR